MAKKTKFIVFVLSGDVKAFGVMTKKSYDSWNNGKTYMDIPDPMGLLFGGCDAVDTYDTWQGVEQSIKDAEGQIADVEAVTPY